MGDDERFASLSSNQLQSILENRDSSNTKQVVEMAKRILNEYCVAKSLIFEGLRTKTKEEIAETLLSFYAEVRKKDGDVYSRSSMISIRFGLSKYFQSMRKFDIINDADFKLPNEMFKAVLTQLKRSGKGDVTHKEVISDADMQKLVNSDVLNCDNPQGLQYKVFLDVMFYTCRRGRENLRKMQISDFVSKTDSSGRRYYQNVAKYETKNHRGGDVTDDDPAGARIYEIAG